MSVQLAYLLFQLVLPKVRNVIRTSLMSAQK